MSRKLRSFLVALCCLIPLQMYILFVWYPEFKGYSGGLANLDSRSGYDVGQVDVLFTALGPRGIDHYLFGSIVDLPYAACFALTVYFLLKIAQLDTVKKRVFDLISLLIPIVYLCADWAENVGIIINLSRYPALFADSIPWFSRATMIKQSMSMISLLYLVILLAIRIGSRFFGSKNESRRKR